MLKLTVWFLLSWWGKEGRTCGQLERVRRKLLPRVVEGLQWSELWLEAGLGQGSCSQPGKTSRDGDCLRNTWGEMWGKNKFPVVKGGQDRFHPCFKNKTVTVLFRQMLVETLHLDYTRINKCLPLFLFIPSSSDLFYGPFPSKLLLKFICIPFPGRQNGSQGSTSTLS